MAKLIADPAALESGLFREAVDNTGRIQGAELTDEFGALLGDDLAQQIEATSN